MNMSGGFNLLNVDNNVLFVVSAAVRAITRDESPYRL